MLVTVPPSTDVDIAMREGPGVPAAPLLARQVAVGDLHLARDFYGFLSWTEHDGRPLGLVGASTGTAPLVSIVRCAAARRLAVPMALLHSSRDHATELLGIILIFIVLNQYLTWTLMGVMEEKASRVVEVLLATVRPVQLLVGKVVGIGAVALAQAVSLVVFALVLAKAVGPNLVHDSAPLVIAVTLVWLVLEHAFYSWLCATAGPLAEREDQVQSVALPLSVPLIFGYIVSLAGVSTGSASLLVKVLSYVPFTAPFVTPTRVGFGVAT